MKKLLALLFLLLIVPTFAVPVVAQDDTIAEIVEDSADAGDAEFTILFELLDEADLVDTLDDDDFEFTVFAPTDEAFEDLLDEMDIDLDDIIDNSELLSQVLLYHVVDGIFEADDLEEGDEVETLQGGTLEIEIDDDTVIINGIAEVVEADIEASNGVIHVIDAVLIPPLAAGSGEACTVSTDVADGASVHVGPGNNRTSVTFLATGVDYTVLGQNEDSEGTIWYQLDKEEAAPGRAINEAWVSSDEVDTTGDCDNIGESSAPPVIPITNAPPPSTSDDSGGDDTSSDDTASDDTSAPATTGALPTAGSWTIFWNATTNASCTGTGNVSIPTVEVFGTTSSPASVSNVSSSGFNFFGVYMTSIGNGVFSGSITIIDLTGTIYIDSVNSSSEMVGRFITSFDTCSATVTFRASR